MLCRLLADVLLLLHASFVAFVVLGWVAICIGKLRGWAWVRHPWFRGAHLIAIAIVVLLSWLGALCPLTALEMELRSCAGDAVYSGSFIAHWLQALLYYQAPVWVFTVGYTLFGVAVAATWFWVRPRHFARSTGRPSRRGHS